MALFKNLITPEHVLNVLAGKAGTGGAAGPMSFPSDPKLRLQLCEMLFDLGFLIVHRTGRLTEEQRTALIYRIVRWLVATGHANERGVQQARRQVDDLVHATILWPTWMHHCGVATVLKNYRTNLARSRGSSKEGAPPVLWREKDWSLIELRSREHLITMGARAGNCVGTLQHKMGLGEPPPKLHYLRRIESGLYRLFMLQFEGEPVATLEYNTRRSLCTQYEIVSDHWLWEHRIISTVFRAFADLSCELGYICEERELRFPQAATPTRQSSGRLDYIILGPAIREDVLLAILATPTVLVEVSHLTPNLFSVMPSRFAARVHCEDEHWIRMLARAEGSPCFGRLIEEAAVAFRLSPVALMSALTRGVLHSMRIGPANSARRANNAELLRP